METSCGFGLIVRESGGAQRSGAAVRELVRADGDCEEEGESSGF